MLNLRIQQMKSQMLASLSTATMSIIGGAAALQTVDKPVLNSFEVINENVIKHEVWDDDIYIYRSDWYINYPNMNQTCFCGAAWNCKYLFNIATSNGPHQAQRSCSLYSSIMYNKILVWSYPEWFVSGMRVHLSPQQIGQEFYDQVFSATEKGLLFDQTSTYYEDTFAEAFEAGFIQKDSFDVVPDMEAYFNSCQPKECVCIKRGRKEVIDILVVLFGLIGGISTVSNFIYSAIYNFHGSRLKSDYQQPMDRTEMTKQNTQDSTIETQDNMTET
eukprot:179936_1